MKIKRNIARQLVGGEYSVYIYYLTCGFLFDNINYYLIISNKIVYNLDRGNNKNNIHGC